MRKISVMLLIVMLVLAACGGDKEEDATQTPPTATAVVTEEAAESSLCTEDAFGCAVIMSGETIKLGIAAPLTGDSATIGLAFSQATQVALALANENPVEGFLFGQVDENDQGTGEGGAAAAERLVATDGLVAVVGHAFSGASREAIPIYEAAGIPMMSPSATNPSLSQNGSAIFNRVTFNDNAQGVLMAQYLYKVLNIKKLAILHDSSLYSTQLAEVAQAEFEDLGGEVVLVLQLEEDKDDYSADLVPVAEAAPEAIFFPGYTPEVAALVNSLEAAGLSDIVLAAGDGVNPSTFTELTGDAGEGVYLSGESEPPDSEEKTLFDTTYQETFGVESSTVSRAIWAAYDSAQVLIQAVRAVAILGDDGNLYIPRQALMEAVRGTSDFAGASGLIACDDTGECNASGPDIIVIQNGELVPVPLSALSE